MKYKNIWYVFILFIMITSVAYASRTSTLPQPGIKTLGSHLTDIDNNFKELYRLIFAGESGYTGLGAGIITSGTLSDSVIPSGITRDTELTSGLATKQNASVNLTTFAGITPSANILSILGAADYPAVRGLLDLEPGVDFLSPAGVTSAITSGIAGKQDTNEHLTDLSDGSLTGSKVGTGINATNVTTGTLPDAVIPSTITRDSELTTALGSYTTTSALTTLLAGKMNTATGTPDGTKFLRDDLTWQIVSAGGGDDWDVNNDSTIDIGYLPSTLIVDTELTTILSDYVLTSVLSDYVTTATLSTNLNNYISSSALTTILSDYIQTGDNVSLGSITSTGSITSSGGADGQIGIWWSGNNTIAPTVTELNGIYPGSDGIYVRWNGSNSLIGAGGSGSVYVDGSIVNDPNLDSNGTVDVSVSGSNISSNVKANSLTLDNLTTGSVITSSESVLNEDTSVMTSGAVVKYINDTVNHLVNTKLSDAGFTIANLLNPLTSPTNVSNSSFTVSGDVYDAGTTPVVTVSLNSGTYESAIVTGSTSPWTWSRLLTLISGNNTIDVRVTASDNDIINLPQAIVNYTPPDTTNPVVGVITPSTLTHDGTGVSLTASIASIVEANEDYRQWSLYDVTDAAVQIDWATFTGLSISSISIPADQHTYRVDVRCTDLAGNIGTASSSNIAYQASGDNSIIFWVGFESGTKDLDLVCDGYCDYSGGSATGTLSPDGVVNTDAAMVGTYGIDCPTGYDNVLYAVPFGEMPAGSIGAWVRYNSLTANAYTITVSNADNTSKLDFRVDATGTHSYAVWTTNAQTVYSTGSNTLSTGTPIWVEYRWNQATNTRGLYVNDSLVASSAAAFTSPTFTRIFIGSASATNIDQHIDNVIVSSEYKSLYSLRNSTTSPR